MKTLIAILILDVLSFTAVTIYINVSIDEMVHEHKPISRPAVALELK